MKKITFSAIFIITVSSAVVAQSNSFLKFKEKFSDEEQAHSFSTNGFFIRTVLGMVGEHEARRAVRHITKVRLITVPKSAFQEKDVTISGFRKELRKDSFEELMHASEEGQELTVFMSSEPHAENRYIMLVEESDEVVLIEVTGHVDMEYLKNHFAQFKHKT